MEVHASSARYPTVDLRRLELGRETLIHVSYGVLCQAKRGDILVPNVDSSGTKCLLVGVPTVDAEAKNWWGGDLALLDWLDKTRDDSRGETWLVDYLLVTKATEEEMIAERVTLVVFGLAEQLSDREFYSHQPIDWTETITIKKPLQAAAYGNPGPPGFFLVAYRGTLSGGRLS